VIEHVNLGDPTGILIVDTTGSLKRGIRSVGVQGQVRGTGRSFWIANHICPREVRKTERRRDVVTPHAVALATKPGLAGSTPGSALARR
jgi:hypothetical protein